MDELDKFILNIPELKYPPLKWLFGTHKLKHKPNTLWLEFGVFRGATINYISQFTKDTVYGFDSFVGLPEYWRDGFGKGRFNIKGKLPEVNSNVKLIKGWFNETLEPFLHNIENKDTKISLLHIDCDLYSSTKYVLNTCKKYLDKNCIIVFDELVNYPDFKKNGELKAFYEFITENNIQFEWLGMRGKIGMIGGKYEKVAVKLLSI